MQIQSGYDWSDAALDARVADGRELGFCRDMMKLELPDRSALAIIVPTVIHEHRHTVDLGGITAVIEHVGGDHAPDSCVVYVPDERVLFLGDCLYQRLHAPRPYLTIRGVRGLTDRLAKFAVDVAVEGHADDVADAAGFAARLAELRLAADLVEAHGRGAVDRAGENSDLVETIEFLLVGEGRAA